MNKASIKKGIKNVRIRAVIISFFIIAVIIGIVVSSNAPSRSVRKQLALGQKYLSELDYEQAVTSFKAVLSIDPMNSNAQYGMEQAYVLWIEALIEEGDLETAKNVLDEALVDLPNNSTILELQNKLNDLDSHEDTQTSDLPYSDENYEIEFDWNIDDIKVNGYPIYKLDFEGLTSGFGLSYAGEVYLNGFKITRGCLYNKAEGVGFGKYLNGKYYDIDDESEISLSSVAEERINVTESDDGRGISFWKLGTTIEIHIEDKVSSRLNEIIEVPYMNGGYNEMNEIFHTEEIIERGEYTQQSNGIDYYDVNNTNLGHVTLMTSKEADYTYYGYSLENSILGVTINYHDDGCNGHPSYQINYH